MVSLWITFGLLFLIDNRMGQSLETASGCYNKTGCPSLLSMSCSEDRRIFIVKAQYGHKSSKSNCSSGLFCGNCCTPEDLDCFSDYSIDDFQRVYTATTCWNGTSCTSRAQQENMSCGLSTFAAIHYSCLRGEDITDFHRNATVTAPAVAVHYDSSDQNNYPIAKRDSYKTWHCQVDTTNCEQPQADVILVRESHANGHKGETSTLGRSGEVFMEYLRTFQYTSTSATMPFTVSVKVGEGRRIPNGWAMVRSQDGSNLIVTCGYEDEVTSTPSCPNTEAPETPTTTGTSNQGVANGLGRTSPAPAAASVNIGAAVGGVVAALVVLVAAVLAVFFLKRWKQDPGAVRRASSKQRLSACVPLTFMTSKRASISPFVDREAVHSFGETHPGVSNPALKHEADVDLGVDYAVIEEQPQPLANQAAALDTRASPRSPQEEPDYDRLGAKNHQSSSSNPAATY